MAERYDYEYPNIVNRYIYAYDNVLVGQFWLAGIRGSGSNYKISSIKFKAFRTGLPGMCTVIVKEFDWEDTWTPIGNVLYTGTFNGDTLSATGPGNLVSVDVTGTETLHANTFYCFYITAPSATGATVVRFYGNTGWNNDDYGISIIESSNGGTTWGSYSYSMYWEVWGIYDWKDNPTKIGGMFVKSY